MKKNKLKNQLIKSLQRQRKLRDEFERLNRVCGLLVNVDKKIADGVNIHTSKQPKESIQDVADELDKPFKEDKSGSYNITQVQDAVNHWSMAFIGIEQIREFLEKVSEKPIEVVDPGITTTIKDWYLENDKNTSLGLELIFWCREHNLNPEITDTYRFIGEINGIAFHSISLGGFDKLQKINLNQFKQLVNQRMKSNEN